ncbi:MAG TPA: hypothetical protein DCY17_04740 [Clostridiales bacterium]|nr:hypothetical protein [Clostridiales bacterium]
MSHLCLLQIIAQNPTRGNYAYTVEREHLPKRCRLRRTKHSDDAEKQLLTVKKRTVLLRLNKIGRTAH